MLKNKKIKYESSFNLQNEFDDDKDQPNKIKFQLSSNLIQISLHNLCKYSQIIQEETILNEFAENIKQKLQNYQLIAKIKEENISIFFKILQENEVIINDDNFFDLCILSELFKVSALIRFLKKYSQQHSNDIDFLINFIYQQKASKIDDIFINDHFSASIEKTLSDNINECLQNKNFEKLHISTIHRIIEKCDINNLSNDKLYEFISMNIKERCILFSFLNLQKLSKEKFIEMYNNYSNANGSDFSYKNYYQYLKNDLNYIKQLKDNEEKLEYEIKQLKNQINKSITDNQQLRNQIDELKEEKNQCNHLNNQLQKKVKSLESENNKLQNEIKEIEIKKKEIKNVYFYDSNNPFNGILNHLTSISNGNIHKNKTIEITCSKICCGPIENLVDFNNNSNYVHLSGNIKPFWLQINFKSRKIQISSYLIKSQDSGAPNLRFLKSWIVEISNDGVKWEKIDERQNISELNGQGFTKLFNVNTKHEPFRCIRIITEEKNWSVPYGDQGFSIGKLELFGDIIE